MFKLQQDPTLSGPRIVSVKNKGDCNITIKCANPAASKEIEELIKNKYQEGVRTSLAVQIKPKLKVTRVYTAFVDKKLTLDQLLLQNPWIVTKEIAIEEDYDMTVAGTKYKSLVIVTDLQTQRQILARRTALFGLRECRCFELVKLIQCVNCSRFKHFARACKSMIRRRKECAILPGDHRCINCTQQNRNGARYGIRHRANDERCPSRIARITAMKELFVEERM